MWPIRLPLFTMALAVVLGTFGVSETQALHVKITETRLTLTSAPELDAAVYNDVTVAGGR